METRICKRCNLDLPIEKFNKSKKGVKGFTSKCRSCIYLAYYKDKRDNNKYKSKLYQIKYFFNLSKEQYEDLVEKCQNSCLICKQKAEELQTGLCVDHCHSTNKVRGLLCQNCNRGLGMFKDNIQFLKNAINYLENQ